MTTLKRLLLGIISSLLLAAGFAHAADRLDPMTQTLHRSVGVLRDDDGGGTPPDDQTPPNLPCADSGN
jgi:hypothetical protein